VSSIRLTRALASLVGTTAVALLFAGPAGAAFLTPEYAMTVTGEGANAIVNPQTVAVDEATHDFYVADVENQRIEKFDASGNFLFNIAGFSNPISIAVDNSNGPSKGDLYVAQDEPNPIDNTITRLDSSGQVDLAWGGDGKTAAVEVRSLAVSAIDGKVWAFDGSDHIEGYIAAYTQDGIQLFRKELRGMDFNKGSAAIDADSRVWFANHNSTPFVGDVERLSEFENRQLGTVYPASMGHFASDSKYNDIFAIANGYEVMVFDGSCDPSKGYCDLKESFAGGQLNDPRGLALDGTTHALYIAVNGGVAVFHSKVIPDVLFKPASIGRTDAILNAHLDPLGEGDITDCAVEYGTDASYGTTVPCDQSLPLESAADVSVHLTGLDTETPYHYRFTATNHNGTTNGADHVFTPHFVKGLETGDATDVSAGGATLHGELDPAGESTHYYFEWGTNKNYGHTTPTLPGSEAAGNGVIQVEESLPGQLTGLTTYHYRLVAVNSLGTSFGSDREFTTPLGSSPQLGSVSATATGPTTAVLRAEINPGFSPTAYKFQYGEDATYGHSTVIGAPIGADGAFHTASVEISGLAPDTTYHFRAVVFNFVDRVASADLTFATLPPPAAPAAPGGGAGVVPTPPVRAGTPRRPGKCKKGFVRKKGKCVRRHRKHHRRGGTA
jgi:hypothetical protein